MTTTRKEAAIRRRDEVLEQFNDAIDSLQDSESFKAWLTTRAKFHSYSLRNSVLIHVQRPSATHVAGYRAWQEKFGRQVRKGEKGIVILRPFMARCKPDDEDYAVGEDGKPKLRLRGFGTTTVFDVAQTEGEPLPEPVVPEAITGDSHAKFWDPLVTFATSIDFTVALQPLDGPSGFCRPDQKLIVIDEALSANERVSVLIHELVHAQGVSYRNFSRPAAETIAESSAYVVCTALGLATEQSALPYVAGWSTREDRIFAFSFIDYYAAVLEKALGLRDSVPARPVHPDESATSDAPAANAELIAS